MRLGRKNVDSDSVVLDQVVGGRDRIVLRMKGDRDERGTVGHR